MGQMPSRSKYTSKNLAIEYHFNLYHPSTASDITQHEGASLYDFPEDQQESILAELQDVLMEGDERFAHKFYAHRRYAVCTKLFIALIVMAYGALIAALVIGYLPPLKIIYTMAITVAFLIVLGVAMYGSYLSSNAKQLSSEQWRNSVAHQLSIKTMQWQTNVNCNAFTFSLYYPVYDIEYGKKNKIRNIRGILRITQGMPKFQTRKEPIYYQAAPQQLVDRQSSHRSLPSHQSHASVHSVHSQASIASRSREGSQFPHTQSVSLDMAQQTSERKQIPSFAVRPSWKNSPLSKPVNMIQQQVEVNSDDEEDEMDEGQTDADNAGSSGSGSGSEENRDTLGHLTSVAGKRYRARSKTDRDRRGKMVDQALLAEDVNQRNDGLLTNNFVAMNDHEDANCEMLCNSNACTESRLGVTLEHQEVDRMLNVNDEEVDIYRVQQKNSIEIAYEVDNHGNIQKSDEDDEEEEKYCSRSPSRRQSTTYSQLRRTKTLPIMINGKDGLKMLVKGTPTVINGTPVVLIHDPEEYGYNDINMGQLQQSQSYNNSRRSSIRSSRVKREIPMSPIQPDLQFDHDTVVAMPQSPL
eukprot:CAMPEP_0197025170 /NCGR_PEP_ID=MMETSP1384-20130603/5573_1 /TAXON_ID=29189 /ORGANISM="Ammonia sp." /LENGTH=580 /DNA_ID=CAMNT_0042453667 /DNA_START=21 /DNA_END=1763 /DNA_ORIENTATION=+